VNFFFANLKDFFSVDLNLDQLCKLIGIVALNRLFLQINGISKKLARFFQLKNNFVVTNMIDSLSELSISNLDFN